VTPSRSQKLTSSQKGDLRSFEQNVDRHKQANVMMLLDAMDENG
jgi:hypothetical protein